LARSAPLAAGLFGSWFANVCTAADKVGRVDSNGVVAPSGCGWLAGQSIEQTICLQEPQQQRHSEHQSGGGTADRGGRSAAASATNHGQRGVGVIVARVTGPNCAKLAGATTARPPATSAHPPATTGHKSTATTGATLFCL